jgi:hypothetical protein
MVPMADFMNHSLTNLTISTCHFDDENSVVNFYSKISYNPGEQVYITYCRESNFELLKSYALFIENNEIQFFELFVSEVQVKELCARNARLQKLKFDFLEHEKLYLSDGYYGIRMDDFPLRLVQLFRVLCFDEEGNDGDYNVVDEILVKWKTCLQQEMISFKNEMEAYRAIIECCQLHLARFPTSLDEDEVQRSEGWENMTENQRLALLFRIEEKKSVLRLQQIMGSMLALLQSYLPAKESLATAAEEGKESFCAPTTSTPKISSFPLVVALYDEALVHQTSK